MANPNAPFGLRAIGKIGGQPWSGATNEYEIASGLGSNIGIGSVVKKTGVGKKIDIAASGDDAVIGVFAGVRYRDLTGAVVYARNWVSGTSVFGGDVAKALVIDDPDVIFEVQTDVTGAAETDIGQYFALSVGAPNSNG